MTTPTDLERAAQRVCDVYGAADLTSATGVLHVLSVCPSAQGPRVIKIGPDSPLSELDAFALDLARARSDVIVVTGRILRDEPDLRYELRSRWADGLLGWRRERAHKDTAPRVLVLTSGRGLDFAHPSFWGWADPVVYTNATDLHAPDHVQIVRADPPSLRGAIAWARGTGATTISIEAGPSTASDLYAPPLAVDEVLLSTYHEVLPSTADAGPSPLPDDLGRAFGLSSHTRQRDPSGEWTLQRWVRRHPQPGSPRS